MKRIAALALSALVLAGPALAQAQHRGGGGYGGGRGGDGGREDARDAGRGGFSGGSRSESGSSVGSGAAVGRGGGSRGYSGGGDRGRRGYGYLGGYGYRGAYYGGLFGFGYGLGGGYFGPWDDGYPFYAASPWFYDYGSGPYGYGRFGPAGYAGGGLGEGYPDWREDDGRPGAWDRDYGTSSAARSGSGTACGQWVWNASAGKYDWAPGACLPQDSGDPPPAPVQGGLRVPG
ncbi:hypothetical protein BH09PSE2_BH09PSE2_09200 [soil metagenome]